MPEYLNRYLAGEHETVWSELIALGERVHEPGVREDAQAVASETMRRAVQNLHTIVRRLEEWGYQFESTAGGGSPLGTGLELDLGALQSHFHNMPALAQQKMGGAGMLKALQSMVGLLQNTPPRAPREQLAIEPPSPAVGKQLKEIEGIIGGKLPLALCAWYEHADGISFIGEHETLNPSPPQGPPTMVMPPAAFTFAGGNDLLAEQRKVAAQMGFTLSTDLPASAPQPLPDPIVLMPLEELLAEIECCAEEGYPGPVALAPDDLHKANISGATWDMQLPCSGADAPFGRWPGFVAYLREVCAWGGFPGWAREPNPPHELVKLLTKDLQPF